MNNFIFMSCLFFSVTGFSQSYAPAAGEVGSTAIPHDDERFVNWANHVAIFRGYINIEDTTVQYQGNNRATFGVPENAVGPANKSTTDVVSLGDGGIAIATFPKPITNGEGFDFAIFENGFSDNYLELAHVEVSSDGEHFVRFPSHSQTVVSSNIGDAAVIDPTYLHNLAGKYKVGFGTPFDLEELKDSAYLDISRITHVKIIDVVGTIGEKGTNDSYGNKIVDPFPTPFASGGFDLNAVGVLHELNEMGLTKETGDFVIYPNPSKGKINMKLMNNNIDKILIYNGLGRIIQEQNINFQNLNIQCELKKGVYFIKIVGFDNYKTERIIIQ